MGCYFGEYFDWYFARCSPGPITNGGGLIAPGRSDVEKAKKWLEDETPVTLGITETLSGVSGYILTYSVSQAEARKYEPKIEPTKAKKLPRKKLSLLGSLPVVTGNLSLSLSWATVQMRDDEELLLLL